jgi:hypothetical protein
MDDRDLEARLSAHLHRRFDDAKPSPDLVRGVEQVFATRPRQLDLSVLGVRSPMRLGYSLTAAAAAFVVLAIAASNLGIHLGPSAGGSPSPSPSGADERQFIVLPPSPDVPSKAESSAAGDVLMARLRALGVGTFTMGGGYGMTFILPASGPADDTIRAVLAAPGVLEFVPIPTGDPTVVAGQTLAAGRELFGSEGVASIQDGSDQNGNPALDVELTPVARQAFTEWTPQHVGDQLAIVMDGRVVSAPIILAPMRGSIQISNESSTGGATLDAPSRAILIGGELPQAWRGAPVVQAIARSLAERLARQEAGPNATIVSSDVQPLLLGIGRWTAVWNIVLVGEFPASCPSLSGLGATCGPTAGTELVVLDGATGGFVQSEAPAP